MPMAGGNHLTALAPRCRRPLQCLDGVFPIRVHRAYPFQSRVARRHCLRIGVGDM